MIISAVSSGWSPFRQHFRCAKVRKRHHVNIISRPAPAIPRFSHCDGELSYSSSIPYLSYVKLVRLMFSPTMSISQKTLIINFRLRLLLWQVRNSYTKTIFLHRFHKFVQRNMILHTSFLHFFTIFSLKTLYLYSIEIIHTLPNTILHSYNAYLIF